MSSLARKFLLFVMALGVLLGTAYLTFGCGYRQGFEDAPRHYYSVDLAKAIRTNPSFRTYVDSLYVATYTQVLDSVIRTDKVVGLVSDWLDAHPGCAMEGRTGKKVNARVKDFEDVFFRGRQ